jgi:hypothetical protein
VEREENALDNVENALDNKVGTKEIIFHGLMVTEALTRYGEQQRSTQAVLNKIFVKEGPGVRLSDEALSSESRWV